MWCFLWWYLRCVINRLRSLLPPNLPNLIVTNQEVELSDSQLEQVAGGGKAGLPIDPSSPEDKAYYS